MDNEGMKNLCCSIISLAIKDIQNYNPKKHNSVTKQNYLSAISFFKSTWFESMTDITGIDERIVRAHIAKIQE